MTYNDSKSVFSTRRLAILGYIIEEGEIRPDPERLRSLRELPVPTDTKSLGRCKGLLSYYSQWIPGFSDRMKPIHICKKFPLSTEAAFEGLKKSIEESVVTAVDEDVLFEVETDASEVAIAATLNQAGRPVAFFSRTLQGPETRLPSIEKEAQAIIESIRHWKHYLTGKHFSLKTDQKSVSYMFDQRHKGKIKNDKIMRWRVELVLTLCIALEKGMFLLMRFPEVRVLLSPMIHCINCTSRYAILVLHVCLTLFVLETCHTLSKRSKE